MAIKDKFGNPKGVICKLMLTGMNWGHSPMAKWAFTQFDVSAEGNDVQTIKNKFMFGVFGTKQY